MEISKKKKIFYLDFIRVISMFIIVTYHFYVHFVDYNINGFYTIFSNGKWGLIGVTLFFMISGASLMYNYKENIDLKKYFKKRFLGIYPMFWIAYTVLFLYLFYINKSDIWGIPPLNILISYLGMDGYLSVYVKTFYLIGEWFLGCIVLIYILFPLVRKLVNRYPKETLIMATIINYLILIFYTGGKMPITKNLFVCLYSFILGMYIIEVKEIKIWQAAIALVVSAICYIIQASNINMNVLLSNLVGYSLFIVFAFIGQKITNVTIQKIFVTISKYTYPIFLVHHYIILKVETNFSNVVYGLFGTLAVYMTIWLIIIIFAKLLYMTNKGILDFFKKE